MLEHTLTGTDELLLSQLESVRAIDLERSSVRPWNAAARRFQLGMIPAEAVSQARGHLRSILGRPVPATYAVKHIWGCAARCESGGASRT